MASPKLPGVGTQSRIPQVQAQQSAFNLAQEESNRRSGLALLSLLANTGIDVAGLVQRARQAAAQREFQREERLGTQEFQAGESLAGRELARDLTNLRESGFENRAADRQAFDLELARQAAEDRRRLAGEGQAFTLDRDRILAKQRADEASLEFQRKKELATQARQLLPQQTFDEAVQQTVGTVIAEITAADRMMPPEQIQSAIDEALMTLARNFPQEAANNATVQEMLARERRRGEVRVLRAQRGRVPETAPRINPDIMNLGPEPLDERTIRRRQLERVLRLNEF